MSSGAPPPDRRDDDAAAASRVDAMAFQTFDAAYSPDDDGLFSEGLGSRLMDRPLEGSDSSGGAYRPWESAERPDHGQQLGFTGYQGFSSPPPPPSVASAVSSAVPGFATPPPGGSPLPGFNTIQQPAPYPLQPAPRELDAFDDRVGAFSAASVASTSAPASMPMASTAAGTVNAVFSPARLTSSPRHFGLPGHDPAPVLTQLEPKRASKRPFEPALDIVKREVDSPKLEPSAQVSSVTSSDLLDAKPSYASPLSQPQTEPTPSVNVTDKPPKKKRKRCGDCVGCHTKDNCGSCAPCKNERSHQICKSRRCETLVEKKPPRGERSRSSSVHGNLSRPTPGGTVFGSSMSMPASQPPHPPTLPPHQPHPPSFSGGQPPWSTPTAGQNGGAQWPTQQYPQLSAAPAPPAASAHFYDARVQYQYPQPGATSFYPSSNDDHFGDPFSAGANGGSVAGGGVAGGGVGGAYPGLPDPAVGRSNGNGFSPGPSYIVSTGAEKGSHLLIPVTNSSVLPKPAPLSHPLSRSGLMVSTTITPLSHAPQLTTSLNYQPGHQPSSRRPSSSLSSSSAVRCPGETSGTPGAAPAPGPGPGAGSGPGGQVYPMDPPPPLSVQDKLKLKIFERQQKVPPVKPVASPHQMPHSPHQVPHSPHQVPHSPHQVAHSPHQVPHSPHQVPHSPHQVAHSPHSSQPVRQVAQSARQAAQSPHHTPQSPIQQMVHSPHGMPQSPHSFGPMPPSPMQQQQQQQQQQPQQLQQDQSSPLSYANIGAQLEQKPPESFEPFTSIGTEPGSYQITGNIFQTGLGFGEAGVGSSLCSDRVSSSGQRLEPADQLGDALLAQEDTEQSFLVLRTAEAGRKRPRGGPAVLESPTSPTEVTEQPLQSSQEAVEARHALQTCTETALEGEGASRAAEPTEGACGASAEHGDAAPEAPPAGDTAGAVMSLSKAVTSLSEGVSPRAEELLTTGGEMPSVFRDASQCSGYELPASEEVLPFPEAPSPLSEVQHSLAEAQQSISGAALSLPESSLSSAQVKPKARKFTPVFFPATESLSSIPWAHPHLTETPGTGDVTRDAASRQSPPISDALGAPPLWMADAGGVTSSMASGDFEALAPAVGLEAMYGQRRVNTGERLMKWRTAILTELDNQSAMDAQSERQSLTSEPQRKEESPDLPASPAGASGPNGPAGSTDVSWSREIIEQGCLVQQPRQFHQWCAELAFALERFEWGLVHPRGRRSTKDKVPAKWARVAEKLALFARKRFDRTVETRWKTEPWTQTLPSELRKTVASIFWVGVALDDHASVIDEEEQEELKSRGTPRQNHRPEQGKSMPLVKGDHVFDVERGQVYYVMGCGVSKVSICPSSLSAPTPPGNAPRHTSLAPPQQPPITRPQTAYQTSITRPLVTSPPWPPDGGDVTGGRSGAAIGRASKARHWSSFTASQGGRGAPAARSSQDVRGGAAAGAG